MIVLSLLIGTVQARRSEMMWNGLYIDALVRMPLHVPAWTVAEVRKQGAHANLRFRRSKIVFGPAILFVNRVIRLDGHAGKRVAALRNLVANRKVVSQIRGQRD